MPTDLTPDALALIGVHSLLLGMFVVSLAVEVRLRLKRRSSELKAELRRGPDSQNTILTLYGLATVALTFAVDVASTAEGWKAVIVIADYSVLTYLFFFNGWFKNRVFAALQRAAVEHI